MSENGLTLPTNRHFSRENHGNMKIYQWILVFLSFFPCFPYVFHHFTMILPIFPMIFIIFPMHFHLGSAPSSWHHMPRPRSTSSHLGQAPRGMGNYSPAFHVGNGGNGMIIISSGMIIPPFRSRETYQYGPMGLWGTSFGFSSYGTWPMFG